MLATAAKRARKTPIAITSPRSRARRFNGDAGGEAPMDRVGARASVMRPFPRPIRTPARREGFLLRTVDLLESRLRFGPRRKRARGQPNRRARGSPLNGITPPLQRLHMRG